MKAPLRRLLWAAALLLLAAVLILVNRPAGEAPSGAQPGGRLPDFTVLCTDGSEFTLSEQRGKVVVVNLWATWCAPCVRELPNFERLQRERPDSVAVLALHAPPVTADVASWLADCDYALPFAVDEDGGLSAAWEVSTVLPETIILDPDGVVRCRHVGALSYEELAALVDEAGRWES